MNVTVPSASESFKMNRRKTMSETNQKNIATMTASELMRHIAELEQMHRKLVNSLRALARARAAEEASKQ